MAKIQPLTGAVKDFSSPVQKKVWVKPEVEIISQDIIGSGQAGFLNEGTDTGALPAVDYNS